MAKITSTTTSTNRTIKRTVPIQNLRAQGFIDGYYIPTAHIPDKDEPLPEYDPLADLYDVEYTHDYDVPFWLSVAGSEGGPIVEWGAGTGRLAIPLARAGFEVTRSEERRVGKECRCRWSPYH